MPLAQAIQAMGVLTAYGAMINEQLDIPVLGQDMSPEEWPQMRDAVILLKGWWEREGRAEYLSSSEGKE